MITLLMAVYAGERPEFLAAAFQSLSDQTEPPDEILLVQDGPLGAALEHVVAKYTPKIGIRSVQLPRNVGLAKALNVGLEEARHPWIMRFDSDDFCKPERVARQKSLIATGDYQLFGSQIEEFDKIPTVTKRARVVPTEHQGILDFGRRRNPFNHMTVCFRKDLAQQCGGYPDIHFMEDYGLWIKLLSAGARAMNDNEALVKARVSSGMLQRRSGRRYVRSEVMLQSLMVRSGFKTGMEAILDGAMRSLVFLMPYCLRSTFYDRFLRRGN